MFEDGAEFELFGFFTIGREVASQIGVFGGEDGFAGFDEWIHLFCPAIVKSIFGDCKIKMPRPDPPPDRAHS